MTNTKRSARQIQLSKLSPEQRALYAEHLRERIYATLTLLAVMVLLWQHPENHSPLGVIGIIAGTVIALWLATIIAARMSYRMVHESSELEPKYREVVMSASGLLAPAGAPVFFVLLAWMGLISLETALLVGVALLILSLFVFSLISGRRSTDNLLRLLGYSALQMALGLAIVGLKLIAK